MASRSGSRSTKAVMAGWAEESDKRCATPGRALHVSTGEQHAPGAVVGGASCSHDGVQCAWLPACSCCARRPVRVCGPLSCRVGPGHFQVTDNVNTGRETASGRPVLRFESEMNPVACLRAKATMNLSVNFEPAESRNDPFPQNLSRVLLSESPVVVSPVAHHKYRYW
jgi:hypothetical protein